MSKSSPFKWRHYEVRNHPPHVCAGISVTRCRIDEWPQMVLERGLNVHHTTVYRWVQRYAPELEKRCRPPEQSTNDEGRVDETYIKIKGKDRYLYREERFDWSNFRLFVDC